MVLRKFPRAGAPNLEPIPEGEGIRIPEVQHPSKTPEALENHWRQVHQHAEGVITLFEKHKFAWWFPIESALPRWPSPGAVSLLNFDSHYEDAATAKLNAKKYFKELQPHIDAALALVTESKAPCLPAERLFERC